MPNLENLVNQASGTADDYFLRAIESIDSKFGKGYAKNNPELIAVLVNAASNDFKVMINYYLQQ